MIFFRRTIGETIDLEIAARDDLWCHALRSPINWNSARLTSPQRRATPMPERGKLHHRHCRTRASINLPRTTRQILPAINLASKSRDRVGMIAGVARGRSISFPLPPADRAQGTGLGLFR